MPETYTRFHLLLYILVRCRLKRGLHDGAFINNIAFIAVYLLFALLTIRSSKQLAEWISTKADLQGDINFSLKKQELLFVLFLGLGIYGLINELPGVLKDGYDLIRDSNKHPLLDDFVDSKKTTNDTFFIELIKSFLFLTLVIYAHVFAAFFARKIDNLEPVDELNNQTED